MTQKVRDTLQQWGVPDDWIGWDQGKVTVQGTPLNLGSMSVKDGSAYAGADDLRSALTRALGLAPVRSTFGQMGVPQDQIGYTPGTGAVTLGGRQVDLGQAFNLGGSVYAQPAAIEQAGGQFMPKTARPEQAYSPQVQSILGQIQDFLSKQSASAQDVMAGPEYKALEDAVRSKTDQEMMAVRQQLIAQGVWGENSGPVADRYAWHARDAGRRLGELVPTLVETERGRQQQVLQNLLSALGAHQSSEQAAHTRETSNLNQMLGRSQEQWSRAITEAGVTGQYRGQPTMSHRFQEAGITGYYDGKPTLARDTLNASIAQRQGGTPTASPEDDWGAIRRGVAATLSQLLTTPRALPADPGLDPGMDTGPYTVNPRPMEPEQAVNQMLSMIAQDHELMSTVTPKQFEDLLWMIYTQAGLKVPRDQVDQTAQDMFKEYKARILLGHLQGMSPADRQAWAEGELSASELDATLGQMLRGGFQLP